VRCEQLMIRREAIDVRQLLAQDGLDLLLLDTNPLSLIQTPMILTTTLLKTLLKTGEEEKRTTRIRADIRIRDRSNLKARARRIPSLNVRSTDICVSRWIISISRFVCAMASSYCCVSARRESNV
jgi:hypothetical protein